MELARAVEAGRRVRDAPLRLEGRPSPNGSYRPFANMRRDQELKVAAAESPPVRARRRIRRLRSPIVGRDRCRRGTHRDFVRGPLVSLERSLRVRQSVKLPRPLLIVQQMGGRSVRGETDDGFSGPDRLEGSTPRDPGRTTPGTESTAPSRAPVRRSRQSDRHQACACPTLAERRDTAGPERARQHPATASGPRRMARPPSPRSFTCRTSSVIRAHPRAASAAAIVDFLPRAGRPGSSRRCLFARRSRAATGGRAGDAGRSRGWGRSGSGQVIGRRFRRSDAPDGRAAGVDPDDGHRRRRETEPARRSTHRHDRAITGVDVVRSVELVQGQAAPRRG